MSDPLEKRISCLLTSLQILIP